MNSITLTGKVGKDPELKFSQNQMAILTFSVADTYGKDDKKRTTWHDIKVFGQLAENVAATISKGSTVIVVGRYQQDEYTKKDGSTAKFREIIADEVGVSMRWNAWVQDQTDKVMAQIGNVFPGAVEEDPF